VIAQHRHMKTFPSEFLNVDLDIKSNADLAVLTDA